MEIPDSCSGGITSDPQVKRAGSPMSSCVSMKSDGSMGIPPTFNSGPATSDPESQTERAASPVLSCVSVKSDGSMGVPPTLSRGPAPSNSPKPFVEKALQTQTPTSQEGGGDLQDSYQPVVNVQHKVSERHKISMKTNFESLFEGITAEENKTLLNRIYTQLYILEGESGGVNKEHEVLQMERTSRKHPQDTSINCLDIFKHEDDPKGETKVNIRAVRARGLRHKERKEDEKSKDKNVRAVLTKGIAGIGKTISVQKFILDWAEGEANQDLDFVFVLPFRELNLIKEDQFNLHGLLCDFHHDLKDLDPKIYDDLKTVFIFDGLDESRIPLDFEQCEKVSDITMTSSVGALMTNLIRGDLLPSARIWITSRPAAANQIPPQHIDRVTEIQGFSDPQKDEYFRKRIRDEDQAQRIISHIKKARSLHIMCHIPVFCWISATVLQRIIREPHSEIPQTLTEMYSHFLLTQINMKNQKYEENEERDSRKLLESNRSMLLKLAELAFKQLMKGNVMFYEEDLRESGVDVTEASVCSGIFTKIFREECVLYQRKVFCFVHLSFQEFLAALYVFHCYESKNMEALQTLESWNRKWSENVTLDALLIRAVEKAIKSESGHLDLFLRFLLGISLESSQKLLLGLLTQTHSSSESISKTAQFIKDQIQERTLPTERSINLFLCLFEMNDQSLSREIQEYLKSDKHSEEKLSPGHCSAITYMLLTSEEVLDQLDLKKFNTTEEGYERLVPAVSVCRKALLAGCNLKEESYKVICSALQSANSPLKDLDLSNNNPKDSGVELLSAGLKSSHCKLETLRLVCCNVTTKSCEELASALQSVKSSLKELDLSNNDLRDSGVELLSAGLKSSHCKLETLRVAFCFLGDEACKYLGSILKQANSSLKELDLSNNDLQDSGVELLSAGLKSSLCKLETLRLSGCMVTEEGCSSLATALQSNPSHLRELDLTYNHPGESGVKLLSDLLADPHCRLEKLHMEHGGKIRMKPGPKKYTCKLTLDPNTAHTLLSQSEGNRKVAFVEEDQPYPDHPDRFEHYFQVLSVESLTGRCYWEAEWSVHEVVWKEQEAMLKMMEADLGDVGDFRSSVEVAGFAVSYRGIRRKGPVSDCHFGRNIRSWTLTCFDDGHPHIPAISFVVEHNSKKTDVHDPHSPSRRVGVYLDWPGGTVSFYSVSPDTHTPTRLYTLSTTFTEPLYAGFVLYDSSLCVCEIE